MAAPTLSPRAAGALVRLVLGLPDAGVARSDAPVAASLAERAALHLESYTAAEATRVMTVAQAQEQAQAQERPQSQSLGPDTSRAPQAVTPEQAHPPAPNRFRSL